MSRISYLIVYLCCLSISAIAQPGVISTIAGNGIAGYGGESVTATASPIYHPAECAIDGAGNLYISEYANHRVRKISPSGVIVTVVGTGTSGFSGDGGPATLARLNSPYGLAIDAANNLYIVDCMNQRIRKVSPSGIISTVAGTGVAGYGGDGGAATAAKLWNPNYITLDNSGNIYVSDNGNHRIRLINTSGIIKTIAGNGIAGYLGDGGQATAARINYPAGVHVDVAGNLYISDFSNNVIRKVTPGGVISTIVGTGVAGSSGDGGAALSAQLNRPQDVNFDVSGNMYIADTWNEKVRIINPSGVISTFAGTGVTGYSGDGGPAVSAKLNKVDGICFDAAGNLIIADVYNHRVRRIGGPSNFPPVFASGDSANLVLCISETTITSPIDTLLKALDANSGQTLTWTAITTPANGIVAGTYTTTSTSATITPAGFTYSPTVGYTGIDSFRIRVSDGIAADTIVVRVAIKSVPIPTLISGIDSVCAGANVTLTAAAGGGTWSSTNGSLATVNSGGVVTGIAAGIVSIDYTLSNECGFATSSYPVEVLNSDDCLSATKEVYTLHHHSLFPNPNNGVFTLRYSSQSDQEVSYSVTNLLGQVLQTGQLQTNVSANISVILPNGVYLFQIASSSEKWLQIIQIQK
jgi:sugar lactone lactonase YvrE